MNTDTDKDIDFEDLEKDPERLCAEIVHAGKFYMSEVKKALDKVDFFIELMEDESARAHNSLDLYNDILSDVARSQKQAKEPTK